MCQMAQSQDWYKSLKLPNFLVLFPCVKLYFNIVTLWNNPQREMKTQGFGIMLITDLDYIYASTLMVKPETNSVLQPNIFLHTYGLVTLGGKFWDITVLLWELLWSLGALGFFFYLEKKNKETEILAFHYLDLLSFMKKKKRN